MYTGHHYIQYKGKCYWTGSHSEKLFYFYTKYSNSMQILLPPVIHYSSQWRPDFKFWYICFNWLMNRNTPLSCIFPRSPPVSVKLTTTIRAVWSGVFWSLEGDGLMEPVATYRYRGIRVGYACLGGDWLSCEMGMSEMEFGGGSRPAHLLLSFF
jgi:hypothetical protein